LDEARQRDCFYWFCNAYLAQEGENMDDFKNTFEAAVAARKGAREAFTRELPNGEAITLGTLEQSLADLDRFLEMIALLESSGLSPKLAAPHDPIAAKNARLLKRPLVEAKHQFDMARRITERIGGQCCGLPLKTVRELAKALRLADAVAARL
jgi:hypothetical protein